MPFQNSNLILYTRAAAGGDIFPYVLNKITLHAFLRIEAQVNDTSIKQTTLLLLLKMSKRIYREKVKLSFKFAYEKARDQIVKHLEGKTK